MSKFSWQPPTVVRQTVTFKWQFQFPRMSVRRRWPNSMIHSQQIQCCSTRPPYNQGLLSSSPWPSGCPGQMRLPSFSLTVQALILTSAYGQLTLEEVARRYTRRTSTSVHLPIVEISRDTLDARGLGAAIGLGDNQDVWVFARATVSSRVNRLAVCIQRLCQ